MTGYILAIDQGTTSSRAILFDDKQEIAAVAQEEFTQHFPHPGWVEHDPADILESTVSTCRKALHRVGIDGKSVAAIGITNQRETTIVWDRRTGLPVYRAIVWQDRRTADYCAKLKARGLEPEITERTGLLLDPYFSASKVHWILENVEGAREAADLGYLAFGTVDSFLLWHLTDGKVHATDATNASRTMLFNIRTQEWDHDLLTLFGVPRNMMPRVMDCADEFGFADPDLLGAKTPILGIAGDQQAATIGQACFEPGMMKSTYGTGCFALLNTGRDLVKSNNRLLTTVAYRLDGDVTYALEGSIFVAGAAVQWLRDGLGLIGSAEESGALAVEAALDQHVYLVPAFTGLGAPWWDPEARGAIYGLSRGTGPAEIARAALESVCYQTRDLLEAMKADWPASGHTVLRVDGGMVASDWTMQFLADILNAPVDRPEIAETTALGAAWLAGCQADVWPNQEEFAASWKRKDRFEPDMDAILRGVKYEGWRDAVARTLSNRD